jgi:hypothetical protein
MESYKRKAAMVAAVLAIFTLGFFAGSIHTRNVMAIELGGLTQTVDSLKNLGKSIVAMEKNVNDLQANINDVKKVRDDLATYQGVYNRVMGTGQKAPPGQQGVSPELQKGILDMLAPQPAPKK